MMMRQGSLNEWVMLLVNEPGVKQPAITQSLVFAAHLKGIHRLGRDDTSIVGALDGSNGTSSICMLLLGLSDV